MGMLTVALVKPAVINSFLMKNIQCSWKFWCELINKLNLLQTRTQLRASSQSKRGSTPHKKKPHYLLQTGNRGVGESTKCLWRSEEKQKPPPHTHTHISVMPCLQAAALKFVLRHVFSQFVSISVNPIYPSPSYDEIWLVSNGNLPF